MTTKPVTKDSRASGEITMSVKETDQISARGWTPHHFRHGGPSGFEVNSSGTLFRCIACREAGVVFDMGTPGPGMAGHTKIHAQQTEKPRKAKIVKTPAKKTAAKKTPAKKAPAKRVVPQQPSNHLHRLAQASTALDDVATQINALVARAEKAEAELEQVNARLARILAAAQS